MTRDAVSHVETNIDGLNGALNRLATESTELRLNGVVTRPQAPDVNELASNFNRYFRPIGDGRYEPRQGADGGHFEALAKAKLDGSTITVLHTSRDPAFEEHIRPQHFDRELDPNSWLFQDRVRREALHAKLNGPSWADRASDRVSNLVGNAVFGNPSNYSSWSEYMESPRARAGRWAVVGAGLAVAAFAGYEFLKTRTNAPG